MFDETWFDEFFSEGLITDVLIQLKSGKEATVYVCRAAESTGAELLAVKAFHPRQGRGFQNRAAYQRGRVLGDARTRRAVLTKTRFGRQAGEAMWVGHEFEMLRRLSDAGADVPRPLAVSESAILMEYVGDEEGPAPQLQEIRLEREEAGRLLDRLLGNVERFLANNVIHADLSPYNVMIREGRAVIIDFPQAIDPRTNANARDLLARDVDRLCRHFERFGVRTDPMRVSADLWRRFLFAEL